MLVNAEALNQKKDTMTHNKYSILLYVSSVLGLIKICSGLTQYMEEIWTKLKHCEQKKMYSLKTDHHLYSLLATQLS